MDDRRMWVIRHAELGIAVQTYDATFDDDPDEAERFGNAEQAADAMAEMLGEFPEFRGKLSIEAVED